jgi:hypothetical protein
MTKLHALAKLVSENIQSPEAEKSLTDTDGVLRPLWALSGVLKRAAAFSTAEEGPKFARNLWDNGHRSGLRDFVYHLELFLGYNMKECLHEMPNLWRQDRMQESRRDVRTQEFYLPLAPVFGPHAASLPQTPEDDADSVTLLIHGHGAAIPFAYLENENVFWHHAAPVEGCPVIVSNSDTELSLAAVLRAAFQKHRSAATPNVYHAVLTDMCEHPMYRDIYLEGRDPFKAHQIVYDKILPMAKDLLQNLHLNHSFPVSSLQKQQYRLETTQREMEQRLGSMSGDDVQAMDAAAELAAAAAHGREVLSLVSAARPEESAKVDKVNIRYLEKHTENAEGMRWSYRGQAKGPAYCNTFHRLTRDKEIQLFGLFLLDHTSSGERDMTPYIDDPKTGRLHLPTLLGTDVDDDDHHRHPRIQLSALIDHFIHTLGFRRVFLIDLSCNSSVDLRAERAEPMFRSLVGGRRKSGRRRRRRRRRISARSSS